MPKTPVSSDASGLQDETKTIGDAIDLLCRAQSLTELIFMAGESISIREKREAITTGADVIGGILQEISEILAASSQPQGGAV